MIKQALKEPSGQFTRLHINQDGKWLTFPEWACFFLELGASFSSFDNEKAKYVAALALPTRSFATCFICSGLTYASFFEHNDEDERHVQQILSLQKGTSVKYLYNGKLKKAIIRELVIFENTLLIGVQIEGEGNKTIYIDSRHANRIELAEIKFDQLPIHQKGRDICPPSDLLDELVPGKSTDFVFRTKIDGVIIGSSRVLGQELLLPLCTFTNEGKMRQGILSEMCRINGLIPAGTGYRFLI